MRYGKPDVYNQPEHFGLTMVGEMEWSEPCYSFDTTIVLKDADGVYYWGRDAGCSCPSPFESFTSLDKLESGSMGQCLASINNELAAEIENWLRYEPDDYDRKRADYATNEYAKLVETVLR